MRKRLRYLSLIIIIVIAFSLTGCKKVTYTPLIANKDYKTFNAVNLDKIHCNVAYEDKYYKYYLNKEDAVIVVGVCSNLALAAKKYNSNGENMAELTVYYKTGITFTVKVYDDYIQLGNTFYKVNPRDYYTTDLIWNVLINYMT